MCNYYQAKKLPLDHNEELEEGEVSEEDSADELDEDFKVNVTLISTCSTK